MLGECQLLTPKLENFHISLEAQAPVALHHRKRECEGPEEPFKGSLRRKPSLHRPLPERVVGQVIIFHLVYFYQCPGPFISLGEGMMVRAVRDRQN